MHPPLRSMPPLAAAATECRLTGRVTILRQEDTDPTSTVRPCSVSLHGDVLISYLLRAVGGPASPHCWRRCFHQVFYLYDPEAFFRSQSSCREIIHQMLARTPVLGDFDLAAENWEPHRFLPDDIANRIFKQKYWPDMGLAAERPRYRNVDVCVSVWARAEYSEPKGLLLACKEVTAAHCRSMAAQGADAGTATRECCICMEDLMAPTDSSSDTLMLPCSHVFHNRCLVPWFHRRSTCPMCRGNMIMYLVAATKTPKGKIPALES